MNKIALKLILVSAVFFSGCSGLINIPSDVTPQKHHHFYEIAVEYHNKDELHIALFYFNIAAELNPENRKITEKIASLKQTIIHKSESHLKKGILYYEKKSCGAAQREFLTALRYNPENYDALEYLKKNKYSSNFIKYKVKKEDTFKSIAKKIYNDNEKGFLILYFNKVNAQTELKPGTILNLPVIPKKIKKPLRADEKELIVANALIDRKDYDSALIILVNILKNDPENREAAKLADISYYQSGENFFQQKKYFNSLKMFHNLNPEYKDVKNRIHIIKEIIKKQIQEAEKFSDEVCYAKGIKLCSQKKYFKAIKMFYKVNPDYKDVKKIIINIRKLLNEQAESHYKRGVKYFVNEKLNKAISEWEKTLNLNPVHKEAKKNIQKAQALLEKLQKVK